MVVSTDASQQEGSRFESLADWGLSVEPACSSCVCMGSVCVLCRPVSVVRSIGNSKLAVGVYVSGNGCLSFCVDWWGVGVKIGTFENQMSVVSSCPKTYIMITHYTWMVKLVNLKQYIFLSTASSSSSVLTVLLHYFSCRLSLVSHFRFSF